MIGNNSIRITTEKEQKLFEKSWHNVMITLMVLKNAYKGVLKSI